MVQYLRWHLSDSCIVVGCVDAGGSRGSKARPHIGRPFTNTKSITIDNYNHNHHNYNYNNYHYNHKGSFSSDNHNNHNHNYDLLSVHVLCGV